MPRVAPRSDANPDPELVDVLQRCAAHEADSLRELAACCGGLLHLTLSRTLGDAELARRLLPSVLAQLHEHAAEFDPAQQSAEDWLYGQARQHARLLSGTGRRGALKLVPAPVAKPQTAKEQLSLAAAMPAEPEWAAKAASPTTIRPRRRDRPASPSGTIKRRSRRGALLGLAAMVLMAVVGLAALNSLPTEAPPFSNPDQMSRPAGDRPPERLSASEPEPPVIPPAANAGPVEALPQAPSATLTPSPPALPQAPDSPGQGTPSDASPAPPSTPAQRAAEAILPPPSLPDAASVPEAASGSLRVFIHHKAGSAADAAPAQRLAEELRQQGFAVASIRPVPFSIGSGSVRYFFAEDRSGARRLLAASSGYLGRPVNPARDPVDFSRYEPKPSPGTVEIWLPSHP